MKYIRLLSLVIIVKMLIGCSGFLDEVDKDKLIPTEVAHYRAVLMSQLKHDVPLVFGIDFMTDDLEEYSSMVETKRKSMKTFYTWQKEIELNDQGENIGGNDAWENGYKVIGVTNYIIEFFEEIMGDDHDVNYLVGEAYFVRAYCYFTLLNLYGLPYDEQKSTYELGVPLRVDNGLEQVFQRNTVKECYVQIEKDLFAAKDFFTKTDIELNKFHPSIDAVNLLLSRLYLYTEQWQKCIEISSELIGDKELYRLPKNGEDLITINSADLIFTMQMMSSAKLTHQTFEDYGWKVSANLMSLYKENDIRRKCYFEEISGKEGQVFYSNKKERWFSKLGAINLRLTEAFLNRAEANVRSGNIDGALRDIAKIVETRYTDPSKITIPQDGEKLNVFILNERRKELCFEENHRWFDLRRMENRPEITHQYTLTDENGEVIGLENYLLFTNDLNYTLPIPLKERENNPIIRNNERYEKMPM